MAEVDPDAERWDDDGGYNYPDPESNWQYLRRLWDTALEDESDAPPLPRPTPPPPEPKPAPAKGNSWAAVDDPWNRDSGYSDEPPFSLAQATSPAGIPDSPVQLSEWMSLPDLPRFLPVSLRRLIGRIDLLGPESGQTSDSSLGGQTVQEANWSVKGAGVKAVRTTDRHSTASSIHNNCGCMSETSLFYVDCNRIRFCGRT
jgi:hypothetical protein